MPADPYASVFRLLAADSVTNLYSALEVINRIRHEQHTNEPIPEVMSRAIQMWVEKWTEMGRRAEEHMRAGRGLNGYAFGAKRPTAEDNQAGNSAVMDAVRALTEGRRLKKGPISEAEQLAFTHTLNNEDALREFFQTGIVHASGAGKEAPLLFWRHGAGDASAVADGYRAAKFERTWDSGAGDQEAAFIADWMLLFIAHRKGLRRWSSVLPQVRRRLGPFLRLRTVRKAQAEARNAVARFQALKLMKGMDRTQWAGWCTPTGLELAHETVRPLWERLAGLQASGTSPQTW